MTRLAILLALSAAAFGAEPSWKPLEFLIGSWAARTQDGAPAGAASSGTYTFRLDLKGHVLSRETSAAGEHADRLYVYPAGGGYRAMYFDNEGHVIAYDVTTPAPQTAVFLSKASEPGPQFRLTYELRGSTMHGRFEIRMPGQADFRPYLAWSGQRVVSTPNLLMR